MGTALKRKVKRTKWEPGGHMHKAIEITYQIKYLSETAGNGFAEGSILGIFDFQMWMWGD